MTLLRIYPAAGKRRLFLELVADVDPRDTQHCLLILRDEIRRHGRKPSDFVIEARVPRREWVTHRPT